MNRKPNKLAQSSSLYLQQHAYNPVDWQMWLPETLAEARQLDKPILLSIGYSSCHWCHVMEKEVFEHDDAAEIMNKHFVCIKVDREEMPAVDNLYMLAVQAMGQQGGWPLNVFLLPTLEPFFGGTYFPKSRWINLLTNIANVFANRRSELNQDANAIKLYLTENSKRIALAQLADEPARALNKALQNAVPEMVKKFDKKNGGTLRSPKFPMPSIWQFLLFYSTTKTNPEVSQQVLLTLQKMASGGIYDWVNGGFCRYSTDEVWHIPHFEKMLYDNAQLIGLYSVGAHLYNNPFLAEVANDTIAFLRSEMLLESGAICSSIDADSEGVEGLYYCFTPDELNEADLTHRHLFDSFFNITPTGNWEHNLNVLHRTVTPSQFSELNSITENELQQLLDDWRNKLKTLRAKKIRPVTDDKVILAWNAQTITGLCNAYIYLENAEAINMALNIDGFITQHLKADGQLIRTTRNLVMGPKACLDDYALLIEAKIALYSATFNAKYLFEARDLLHLVYDLFSDSDSDFFFYSPKNEFDVLVRQHELFDNVIPSGNSVMASNLLILSAIFEQTAWLKQAERMASKMVNYIENELYFMGKWAGVALRIANGNALIVGITNPNNVIANKPTVSHPLVYLVLAEPTSGLPCTTSKKTNGDNLYFACHHQMCHQPQPTIELAYNLVSTNPVV